MAIMMPSYLLLARRLVRNQLKMPSFMLLSISQPLMYLLFFGIVFSRVPHLSGGTINYMMYLTPGMGVLAAFFGSAYTAITTLGDIESGYVDRLIVSPISRFSIAFSYVLANLLVVVLQVIVVSAVGCVVSGFPPGGFSGTVEMLGIACIVAVAFGSLSNAVGYLLVRTGPVLSFMNFITLPLMFLSGMLISPAAMPEWVAQVTAFNPLNWAVTAAQQAYLGTWNGAAWQHLALITVFSLLCVGLMQATFLHFMTRR